MRNIRKIAIKKPKEGYVQGNRITGLHGVLLPPKRKKETKGFTFITFRFLIKGTIPSKKNMIWADSNLQKIKKSLYRFSAIHDLIEWLEKNLKVFVRNSEKYKKWVKEMHPIIIEQAAKELSRYQKYGLSYPLSGCSLKIYHYFRDNVERDLSNKLATIEDLLVDCNILAGDQWQHLNKIESEGENYYKQIIEPLTTVDITVMVKRKETPIKDELN